MIKQMLMVTAATVSLGAALAPGHAWAQANVLTENVNNTGIPRQAPSLGLGQIYGLNPCATGATAGLTTPLFGIAGAVSNIDRECETRNNAAVVVTALKDETMAREILCQIKDVREAAIRMGKPCIQDQSSGTRRSDERQPTPVAQISPPQPATTPPPPAPPLATAARQHPAIRVNAPAFCYLHDLDLQLYPDCLDGKARSSVSDATQPASLTHPPAEHVTARAVHPAVRQGVCGADCASQAKADSELASMRVMVLNEMRRRLGLDARQTRIAAK